MDYRLIITEKPSVAKTLSAILGATQRMDGYFEGNGWLISWCYDHLVEMASADAYGEQYKRWSYDALPILPDIWKYLAADGKKNSSARSAYRRIIRLRLISGSAKRSLVWIRSR